MAALWGRGADATGAPVSYFLALSCALIVLAPLLGLPVVSRRAARGVAARREVLW